MLDGPALYALSAALLLLGPVRAALRIRAQILATGRARTLGPVTCAKCNATGVLIGYGTFFGRQELWCGRCRSPAKSPAAAK